VSRPLARIFPSVLGALVGLAVLATTGCAPGAQDPSTAGKRFFLAPVMPEALARLKSTGTVAVTNTDALTFAPVGRAPRAGLVFYPGGYVDPRAYGPAAMDLAERGFLVTVPRVPFGLAFSNAEAATECFQRHPEVPAWAVGGHSVGGVVAALYAKEHPDTVKGLVFWASYPADSTDLSKGPVKVLSVSGTLDGLSTPDKLERVDGLLPSDATRVRIEGGNHAQFGWYGFQDGDRVATLTREEQQRQLVEATATFLGSL